MSRGRYLPIADYALIGDTRSAALVARDGGIDWCCLPAFDSPSVFGRLLDDGRGGHFAIAVPDAKMTRRYVGESNVLETTFRAPGGVATLTDAMPVAEVGDAWFEGPWVLRVLRCTEGEVGYSMTCRPAPFYAGERLPRPETGGPSRFAMTHGLISSVPVSRTSEGSVASGILGAGESVVVAFGKPNGDRPPDAQLAAVEAEAILDATRAWWEQWASRAEYAGAEREQVVRSALTLKALTYSPAGSMVAAPTTSLPERIGGELNWDYRYCWLRDATLGFMALDDLGYHEELAEYWHWIERATELDVGRVSLMYRIDGGGDLDESELVLRGYRDSRPVRVGNAAAGQFQLDTFGWVLAAADRFSASGGWLSAEAWAFLGDVVEQTIARWREPDAGIWEVREGLAQLVYSKAMCWLALDRAIAIAEREGRTADLQQWRAERQVVRAELLARGIDERLGRFTGSYEGDELDASLLQLVRIGLVPARHPAMAATIDALERELTSEDGLLYRNELHGPKGFEGVFAIVCFWLADCLVERSEPERARALIERVLSYANDLGLLSEELDPSTDELLGNFPQAFSHTGHIQSAVRLACM